MKYKKSYIINAKMNPQIVSAAEAHKAIAAGHGSASTWTYKKPDFEWSSTKIRNVLVNSRSFFVGEAQKNLEASDMTLQALVYAAVEGAEEASKGNTTSRAFFTLLSRSSSTETVELVLQFLNIRCSVENGELSEVEAGQKALDARLKLTEVV
jgi:hypothetical protein